MCRFLSGTHSSQVFTCLAPSCHQVSDEMLPKTVALVKGADA